MSDRTCDVSNPLLWCCATQLFGSAGMLAVCLAQLDLVWMVPTYLVNGLGGGSYVLQAPELHDSGATAVELIFKASVLKQ